MRENSNVALLGESADIEAFGKEKSNESTDEGKPQTHFELAKVLDIFHLY